MKVILNHILYFCLFLLSFYTNAQIGIGTVSPHSSSILDIQAINKGILIPQIALTSTTDNTTIVSPKESLLIYNTNAVSDVTPGFYYWSSSKWNKLLSGNSSESKWTQDNTLNGTKITTQSDGSTLRTSAQNIFIKDDGKVGIGTSVPQGALHIATDSTDDIIITRFTNTPSNDVDLDFIKGEGTASAPSVITTSGTSLGGIRFRSFINPLTVFSNPLTAFAPTAEIAAETDDGTISTTSSPGRLVFKTTENGSINSLTRLTIKHNGNIIVGSGSSADVKLKVEGMLQVNTQSGESGLPTHTAPAGTIIFQNSHFYGNTDGSSSGWTQLDN